MDDAAELTLTKQELNWESMPGPGQVVLLRDNSNLSTGGTATDVTDEVHPDNAAIAVLAARTMGLDIAGVDVVCQRINRPLAAQHGGIVEVNAAPGLRMHISPSEGKPRPVGEAIMDMLFPDGRPYRIPDHRRHRHQRQDHRHAHDRRHLRHDAQVRGHDHHRRHLFRWRAARRGRLQRPAQRRGRAAAPRVEVAVLETARGGILRSGLGWDRCQVAVVTNVSNDHLGLDGIDSLEDLALVKRCWWRA